MRHLVPAISLLATISVAAACTSGPVGADARTTTSPAASVGASRDLATLRRVVAPLHDFSAAQTAGWSAKITACMADPTAGAMGFHYGNVGLIDGAVRVDEPELLLYEPEKNGQLRLVAVEYVLPYTFHPRDAAAPELFGQQFKRNDRFQLWGLHASVGEENPSGMFASWNPRVTCANTTDLDVAPMAHD